MKRLLTTAAALALALTFSAPVFAATATECTAMFTKADVNHNGSIDGAEAVPYIAALKKAGMSADDANSDGKLSAAEFQKGCEADAFKDMPK